MSMNYFNPVEFIKCKRSTRVLNNFCMYIFLFFLQKYNIRVSGHHSDSSDSDGFVSRQCLSLPHQSLVEFEEFEAAMDPRDSTERSRDDSDLIGAYLQRLSEQDSDADDGDVSRRDATSDWLDQQMCGRQRLVKTESHDGSQLNSARESKNKWYYFRNCHYR